MGRVLSDRVEELIEKAVREVNVAHYYPNVVAPTKEFQELASTENLEFERFWGLLWKSVVNGFVEYADSDGLVRWEKMLGIRIREDESLAERRKAIIIRLNTRTPYTERTLQYMMNSLSGDGAIQVKCLYDMYLLKLEMKNTAPLNLRRVKSFTRQIIPANLGCVIIAIPSRQMFLNRCGPMQIRPAKATTWTETQRHVVFSCGLNASGEVETISRASTTRRSHLDRLFSAGTLSGRLRLNHAAKTTTTKDLGGTITEHWLVFVGSRTNSQAPLRLNDARTEARSRSYHRADWREVSCYTNCLNAARSMERRWQEVSSRTTTARRFKRPGYALNQCGTVTTKRMDVGHDVAVTESLFTGAVLNNAGAFRKVETVTQTVARERTVFTGARLNSRKPIILSQACSSLHVEKQSRTITKSCVQFTGSLLSGKLILNGGKPMTITRTVHIPVWRDVKCYKGAALLNAAAHHIKEIRSTHTEQGHPEKYFDPRRGTLLNDHAVLGYLRL